jgi:fringe protein
MLNITTTLPSEIEIKEDSSSNSDYINTPQSNIELDDIFISVKTTKKYHDTRLRLIVETWFQLARDQVSNANWHML